MDHFKISKTSKTLVPLVEKRHFGPTQKWGMSKTINHLWTEPKRDPIGKPAGMDFPTTLFNMTNHLWANAVAR